MMKRRNPAAAFIISLFGLGLGQLYNGQLVAAIVLNVASWLVMSLLMVLYGYGVVSYTFMCYVALSSLVLLVGAAIVAAVQAASLKEFTLRRYNRFGYYFLFVVILSTVGLGLESINHKFFSEPFHMSNNSMSHSVPIGYCVMVKKASAPLPKVGDIVVWRKERFNYVSKVAGTPGDTTYIISTAINIISPPMSRGTWIQVQSGLLIAVELLEWFLTLLNPIF